MQEPVGFRDHLYTVDAAGDRNWVYSNIVRGRFFRRRLVVAYLLMAIYLAMPWITIGGKQAVLLDITNRKFTFFGAEFWATDTLFLMLLLGSLGITLFFVTALFGRLWCGWACPETVFLEFLFRPIERLIEGNAAQRKRLDEGPWNFEKIWKKATRHGLSAFCAWILSTTALAYFFGSHRMIEMITHSPTENLFPFILTIVFLLVFGFQFGWFREQFCTVLCPYARFQSVMLDPNSLVIGYDVKRGEPRGKVKGGESNGDCVDCGLCVRVCPTGIDIRNGLQLECVNCAACIDACDSVMDKVSRPQGLIRYDTENRLLGRPTRIFRPRIVVYSFVLLVYVSLFIHQLVTRNTSEFQLVRATHEIPFSVLGDGEIMNNFEARISNKGSQDLTYTLEVLSPAGLKVILPASPYPVSASDRRSVPAFIEFPRHLLKHGKFRATVLLQASDGAKVSQEITLLGPESDDDEDEDDEREER